MSVEKIIIKGEPGQLKPMFIMAEFLYEVMTLLESQTSSGGRDITSVPRNGHPEIFLYFLQDPTKSVGPKNVKGQISFRLMSYTLSNISSLQQTTLVGYGQRIKELFGEPAPGDEAEEFVWNKGKNMCTYGDWSNGLQLQVLCNTQGDGISVIERVVEIAEATYHPEYVNFIQNNDPALRYPSTPVPVSILGHEVTPPVQRPVVGVRFQRAWVSIPGMLGKITLYDVRGNDSTALVK
jgi:hypothetical protein